MDTKKELKILFWLIVVYAAVFFMPLGLSLIHISVKFDFFGKHRTYQFNFHPYRRISYIAIYIVYQIDRVV